jgi:hypothetical protein
MRKLNVAVITITLTITTVLSANLVQAASETLVVPYASGPWGPVTERTYTGRVTIEVSGSGQAAGTSYSDAFYRFTDEYGRLLKYPVAANEFGLYINQVSAVSYIGSIPRYTSTHNYKFTINVSDVYLHFQVGVGDEFVNDNSGRMIVTLSQDRPSRDVAGDNNLYVPYPAAESWRENGGFHEAWGPLGMAQDFGPNPGASCPTRNSIDTEHHILAMRGGTVIRVNTSQAWVAIDHGQGLIGFYLHVGNVEVREGQRVYNTTVLGNPSRLPNLLGFDATGCHVHVAFATYDRRPPTVGQFEPNRVNWASTFPNLMPHN